MACDSWTEKLDAYFDGELPPEEARTVHEHLRGCPGCAAEGVVRLQQKRAVQSAAQRYMPDPAFRARIEKTIAARRPSIWSRSWIPVFAATAALLIVAIGVLSLNRSRNAERQSEFQSERQLVSELVDQHVATLASASPVDVVSTDRHTVKPWFAGKIPFTFNLPELQDSPFTLAGGRLSYLNQSPGAELLFRVRQHQISVFIFQERGLPAARADKSAPTALSFEVRSWRRNGLRYFVIGDASPKDLDTLSELLRSAG
jgi:anti-sigma factor RsiW